MAHIRTMSSRSQDEQKNTRRALLKGLCSVGVGAALTPVVLQLSGARESFEIDIVVKERVPAGSVFLVLSNLEEAMEFSLSVRRVEDDIRAVSDRVCVDTPSAEVELILDLPDTRWVPGAYEMRIEALRSDLKKEVWRSSWLPAFTLRSSTLLG
jgi:hypothetical protein